MSNINTKPAQDLAAGEIDGSSLFNKVSKMDVATIRKTNGKNTVIRKVFGAAAVVAFIGLMAWHVSLNPQPKKGLSDLNLANIEALAVEGTTEHPPGGSTQVDCYSTINECWIFSCSYRYRCSVTAACPSVRSDGASKPGKCYK